MLAACHESDAAAGRSGSIDACTNHYWRRPEIIRPLLHRRRRASHSSSTRGTNMAVVPGGKTQREDREVKATSNSYLPLSLFTGRMSLICFSVTVYIFSFLAVKQEALEVCPCNIFEDGSSFLQVCPKPSIHCEL